MNATLTKLPRGFRMEIAQLKLAIRQRRQAALAAIDENTKCVRLESKCGLQLIVHRSTYREYGGQWQLTTLGADGTPYGHSNAPTLIEAVLRAVGASLDGMYNEHGFSIMEVV